MKRISEENVELGRRLRKIRENKMFSAEHIAASIGVASSTYREWENGRAISGQPYKKLAAALGVSVYEILGLEDSHKQTILLKVEQLESLVRDLRNSL